ncbi:MAG TPA: hypothetical protein VGP77_10110, partial [Vicinamibacterales bacterium]|nr:hypothetical protein [Vicinamibacterales bacterium]
MNFVMRDPRWNARIETSTTVQYTVIFGLKPPVSCTLSSPDVRVCIPGSSLSHRRIVECVDGGISALAGLPVLALARPGKAEVTSPK